MDKLVLGIICIGVVLIGIAVDEPTERAEHESYCELVAMWEADRARGIDVYDRAGHPNFNRVECDAALAKADGE